MWQRVGAASGPRLTVLHKELDCSLTKCLCRQAGSCQGLVAACPCCVCLVRLSWGSWWVPGGAGRLTECQHACHQRAVHCSTATVLSAVSGLLDAVCPALVPRPGLPLQLRRGGGGAVWRRGRGRGCPAGQDRS